MRFKFIDDYRYRFPINLMCRVLRVSRSGYYDWKTRDASQREQENYRLLRLIEDIHQGSRGTYGSPRIYEVLRGMGEHCSKSRVERLMKKAHIFSKMKKKFRVTTNSKHKYQVAKNKLNRNFNPPKANASWASDITYIWTEQGWLYLAVVLDLYSRKVIGWSMKDRITEDLVSSALKMAINIRGRALDLTHHSDRGVQYCAKNYQKLLKAHKIIPSMSRKGNCWDNAVVESFFHTLKTEMVYFEKFKTKEEAKQKIFDYIEIFYNRKRIHSSLGFKTPVEYEKLNQVA